MKLIYIREGVVKDETSGMYFFGLPLLTSAVKLGASEATKLLGLAYAAEAEHDTEAAQRQARIDADYEEFYDNF